MYIKTHISYIILIHFNNNFFLSSYADTFRVGQTYNWFGIFVNSYFVYTYMHIWRVLVLCSMCFFTSQCIICHRKTFRCYYYHSDSFNFIVIIVLMGPQRRPFMRKCIKMLWFHCTLLSFAFDVMDGWLNGWIAGSVFSALAGECRGISSVVNWETLF